MKLHVVLILLPTVALLAQKPENFGAGAVQGDGESMLINQAADEKIKRSRVLPRQLIPIQYFLGLPISLRTEGVNMGISYRFSKGRELRGYRNLYESFYWYPRLRLGFINTQLWGTYSGGGVTAVMNLKLLCMD